jgi:hypothetical protein
LTTVPRRARVLFFLLPGRPLTTVPRRVRVLFFLLPGRPLTTVPRRGRVFFFLLPVRLLLCHRCRLLAPFHLPAPIRRGQHHASVAQCTRSSTKSQQRGPHALSLRSIRQSAPRRGENLEPLCASLRPFRASQRPSCFRPDWLSNPWAPGHSLVNGSNLLGWSLEMRYNSGASDRPDTRGNNRHESHNRATGELPGQRPR